MTSTKELHKKFREAFAASGGHGRATKLTKAQRSAQARKAARARWAKKKGPGS